jgi:hypothetical protein
MKNILTVTALALASLTIAAAGTKSYEIVLDATSQAGKTVLSAGHYRVKATGEVAEFYNVDNGRTTSVPVKVATSPSKSEVTAVEAKTENGVSQIQAIDLRDSNTKLEF